MKNMIADLKKNVIFRNDGYDYPFEMHVRAAVKKFQVV